MMGVTLYAFFNKQALLQKWSFGALFLFSIFIFLEEIDYGAHFIQFFTGERESYLEELTGVYNVHGQGNNPKIFKRSVEALMGLMFVVAPFMRHKIKHPLLSYLIPQTKIIFIAILSVFADLVPRLLVAFGVFEAGGLGINNVGEFAEVMIYYIFLIYLIQLIFENEWTYSTAKVCK